MAKRQSKARKATKKSKAHAASRSKTRAKAGAQKENTKLKRELSEALERQRATGEILTVINRWTLSSKPDLESALESVLECAIRLCGAMRGHVYRCEKGFLRFAAASGAFPGFRDWLEKNPLGLDRGSVAGRAALEGKVIHVQNVLADPEYRQHALHQHQSYNSVLAVPMVRGEALLGVIVILKSRIEPFTDRQIELVSTFADQAVIAIENVRMFDETRAALERETATANILKVIAGSPNDVKPVFDAIADSSKRLIGSFSASVFRFVDGIVQLAAYTPISPAADKALKASFPRPVAELQFFDLAKGGQIVQEADTETNPDGRLKNFARARGFRSAVLAPLMSKQTPIGLIVVTRKEAGQFADHHVQLLQTFADQAVIAIENTRLFNETQEALERQTATADVLKVIAGSPTNLQPIFEAIAQRSNRLLGAHATAVYRFSEDTVHLMAFTPVSPEADAALKASYPRTLASAPNFKAVQNGEVLQIPDAFAKDVPDITKYTARVRGFRSLIFMPLSSDSGPIGAISVTRKEVGAFSEHHVQLLRTFADQAVIAISNVELFKEVQAKTHDLGEALQQQTATADVLKVISRSAFDLQTVFETLVQSAAQLCRADKAAILRLKDNKFHIVATYGFPPQFREFMAANPMDLDRGSVTGRAA
jgi:GAF domain-containing protein